MTHDDTRHETTPPTLTRRLALLGTAAVGATGILPAASAGLADPAGTPLTDPVEVLRRLRVPRGPASAAGPVWSPVATGFAGVPTDEHPDGTVAALTLENAYDPASGGDRPATPLRSADDSLHLEDVLLVGGEQWISDPR